MIIVTGGAGFIGSNLILGLNASGRDDILVVDDLTDGTKFRNLVECRFYDYWDIEKLSATLSGGTPFKGEISAVFHQGACSNTTEWNGRYLLQNNYEYSKLLLHHCLEKGTPFIYASSAAVYGTGQNFRESDGNESPVNVYGYSKCLFDRYVRRTAREAKTQVTGLRYFNVYGPREQHKQSMASVVFHFNRQLLATGRVKLFRGSGGYADGEQRRDFIHVNDVVAVNLWCLNSLSAGAAIYNVGTGNSCSFNEVARAVIDWHGHGEIEYVDFPEQLEGSYQSFTQADISALHHAGYRQPFISATAGVTTYLDWLNR